MDITIDVAATRPVGQRRSIHRHGHLSCSGIEPSGQVSIWDETAQRYLAFACPPSSPTTYRRSGTFDLPGPHQLVASYNTWWPERVQAESPRYTHRVVGVTLTGDKAADPVRGDAGFTVTVTTGVQPPAVGQVSIWDATAQRYLAFACPSSGPDAYHCSGRFESAGSHELVASYNLWWPDRLQGVSSPVKQPVTSPDTIGVQQPSVTVTR